MNKQDKEKLKEWTGSIIAARTKKRSEYAGSPAIIKWFMDFFEDEIVIVKKKNKKAKVLILGSTPEIRDLVKKHGLDITIIDQSREMIENMSALMEYKGLENIVAGNWLSMPFEDNFFDLVLGDAVSNNVSYKELGHFFKEINRVLKKDGIMLLREMVVDDKDHKYTVEEIVSDYRKNKDCREMWLKLYLASDLGFRNVGDNYFDMGKTYENIERQKELFDNDAFEKLMSWGGTIKHTIIEEKELQKIIEKVFQNAGIIKGKIGSKFILKKFKFFRAQK